MKAFNLKKESQIKNYNNMIEEKVHVPPGDTAEKNINLSIKKKEKDNSIIYENQLKGSRQEKTSDQTITEKELDSNNNRLDQTGDIMPINLETIKHEQQKEKIYRDATTMDKDTSFWDQYVDISLGVSNKIPVDKANTQLQNKSDRFSPIDDSTKAKYDRMVFASSNQKLKDADAMLLHIYTSALSQNRKLSEKEQRIIHDINQAKIKILSKKNK